MLKKITFTEYRKSQYLNEDTGIKLEMKVFLVF